MVALVGLETVLAAGMSEGKVGWMVLAAASALLWELGPDGGFTWKWTLMRGARGTSLEGVKAVEKHRRCMMQTMQSDDVILNIFTRTTKGWQCHDFFVQASEQTRRGICEYILLFCSALVTVANTSTAATYLRLRRAVAQV